MTNKIYGIVLLALLPACTFAADHAVGVSLAGGYSAGIQKASLPALEVSSQTVDTAVPLAASVFGDFGYVAMSLGFAEELLGHQTLSQTVSGATSTVSEADTGTREFLTGGVFARIPISLGTITLIPTVGLEGDVCIVAVDAQGNDLRAVMSVKQLNDLNEAWIKAGAALRIPLVGALELQPWLLVGYQFPTPGQENIRLNVKAAGLEPFLVALRGEAGVVVALGF